MVLPNYNSAAKSIKPLSLSLWKQKIPKKDAVRKS
jgi:hypothetical protein